MYDAQQQFFTIYQGKDANEQEYMEIFNTNIMVLDQTGKTVMDTDNTLTELILNNYGDPTDTNAI